MLEYIFVGFKFFYILLDVYIYCLKKKDVYMYYLFNLYMFMFIMYINRIFG